VTNAASGLRDCISGSSASGAPPLTEPELEKLLLALA
jgi:hypothetical protein